MTIPNSNINWKRKGFGWIPDLPDITDPGLKTALNNQSRILTQEGVGYAEEIATSLLNVLENAIIDQGKNQDISLESEKLSGIRKKLLGDTRFPNVKVYKILRRNIDCQEVIQLRQVLFFISQEKDFANDELLKKKTKALNKKIEKILELGSLHLVDWLQQSFFDENLEDLVKFFQETFDLLNDGIVGLITYAEIERLLAKKKISPSGSQKQTSLLCSSSLVSHEILKEIFQGLTYLWLYEKFRAQIEITFNKIRESYPFNSTQSEEIQTAQIGLECLARESLEAVSVALREQAEKAKNPEELEEILKSRLEPLKKTFSEKIDCLENRFQDISFLSTTDSLRERIFDGIIIKRLEGRTESASSFIAYPNNQFYDEFHRWFHIIDPFASALFQVLSPLAKFDNPKQAVRAGFDRLDSCFKLHHLGYESRLSVYRNLFTEYSPVQIADQLEDLKILRSSVINLFQETLAKIERKRDEDLILRIDLIECLVSSWDKSKSNENKLENNYLGNVIKLKDKYSGQKNVDRIDSMAYEIFKLKKLDLKLHGTEKLKDEKRDISIYLSFFEFIEDVIKGFYKISSGNLGGLGPGDAANDEIQKASLTSFLAAKKELFQIDSGSLLLDGGKPQKNIDHETSSFFNPVNLQLPVSSDLLEKLPREPSDDMISYFFLPGVVDLSYWCPPVEDQGEVNACTAFAGVSLLEYFAQKRYGKYTNLSTRFLYKTARNLMDRSDNIGASVRQTMKALVLFGVPPEEAWPWRVDELNEEPPAFCYAYAQSYQTLKYFRLDGVNIVSRENFASQELLLFQIKAVLAAGLPCIFGFTAYTSFYREQSICRGHISYPSDRDQIVGGHAAVAVGYNDHKMIERIDGKPASPGAVLIRNSWGTAWGNGGYGWMPYDYVLDGLTADWWSLLKSEWFDGGAFGLGATDPGSVGGKETH